jgi:chromosome segregation ATPase
VCYLHLRMNTEKIKSDIKKLHLDLSDVSEVDGEVLKRLKLLEEEIHDLLTKSEALQTENPEKKSVAVEGQVDLLSALATELTNQHPKAAQTLREIAYALGRMGI